MGSSSNAHTSASSPIHSSIHSSRLFLHSSTLLSLLLTHSSLSPLLPLFLDSYPQHSLLLPLNTLLLSPHARLNPLTHFPLFSPLLSFLDIKLSHFPSPPLLS